MRADRKETLRYLGYGGQEMEPQLAQMIEETAVELEKGSSPKSIYQEYACQVLGDKIKIGELTVQSHHLAVNLKGCEQAVLLAATIGRKADLMIRKYSVCNMAKAAVVQAAGAACIENYVDEVEEEIRKNARERGLYLRPRFSPGYGDFALECQRDIFQMLECSKRIGVTLTEGNLMMPSKSVTAVIGLTTRERESCQMEKCSLCAKTDCEFRQEGEDL
ncbi:MAG: Vitamin B12 dependent methionine synthase activation subunit [Lachnospiraceae bacterium]|nr:Vitamin B12 dependent methionine synthase activation subunit [Lachnospiraceae bacterium]